VQIVLCALQPASQVLTPLPALRWWPPTGISDTTILPLPPGHLPAPTGSRSRQPTAPNIISNGSFTDGNSGFTSDYRYAATSTGNGDYGIGQMRVLSVAHGQRMGDHTTGTGNMMIVDGAATGPSIWRITVIPWCQAPITTFRLGLRTYTLLHHPHYKCILMVAPLGSAVTPTTVGMGEHCQ